jgi:hypothetical protein
MLFILIDIFIIIRIRKRTVIHPTQFQHGDARTNHQKNLQLQMLILMLTSTIIFLITTLPLGIYKITSPREANLTASLLKITSIWTGLGWFQSLNYAVSICMMHIIYLFSLFVAKLLQSLSYVKIISTRI